MSGCLKDYYLRGGHELSGVEMMPIIAVNYFFSRWRHISLLNHLVATCRLREAEA